MQIGTLITAAPEGDVAGTGDADDQPLVSAITSKNGVQLVDIQSTRMLGQYGFLAKVFDAFAKWKISIDVIALLNADYMKAKFKNRKALSRT